MATTNLLNGIDLKVLTEIGEAGRATREATKFTLAVTERGMAAAR